LKNKQAAEYIINLLIWSISL